MCLIKQREKIDKMGEKNFIRELGSIKTSSGYSRTEKYLKLRTHWMG